MPRQFRARLRRQSDNYVPKSHRSRTRTLLVALRQTTCSQILDTPDTECLASSDRTHASGQTLTPHLAAGSHVLCGKHGRVRGCLIAVSLNLHSAGHADHGLPPRQVGDVLQARGGIQSTHAVGSIKRNNSNMLGWRVTGSSGKRENTR